MTGSTLGLHRRRRAAPRATRPMPDLHDRRHCGSSIEARAAATPDASARRRRARPHDDLRRVPGRVPSAPQPGFAALGVDEGTPVSWQLPTWIESFVLVGALARLGAVQNPILPICREREVGFMTRQTGAQLLIVPGHVARLRLRGDGRAAGIPVDDAQPGPQVVDRQTRDLGLDARPRRDPARSPAIGAVPPFVAPEPARCAGSSTRRGRPPIPRACGTPTRRLRRRAHRV